jgi:hypothetical protein
VKRRTALSIFFAGPALCMTAPGLWAAVLDPEEHPALDAGLPPLTDPEAPDLAVFERLCEIVCLAPSLDPVTTVRLYDLIKVEPWGLHHVGAVYGKLLAHRGVDGRPRPLNSLLHEGHLSEGEAWFVSHLLTTWYLGIYYHESQPEPVRVSFETSRMWAALKGHVEPPGFSTAAPGDWSRPPPGATGEGRSE